MKEPIYNNPEYEECSWCKGAGLLYANETTECPFCKGQGQVEKEELTDWDRADDLRDWANEDD